MKRESLFSLSSLLKSSDILLKFVNREIDEYDLVCTYMAALENEIKRSDEDAPVSPCLRQESIKNKYNVLRKKYQSYTKKQLEAEKLELEAKYQEAKRKKEEMI